MAPRLTPLSTGRVRNFYESSFRQLSDIQQRQVGLLLGAAVGDAAARPHAGQSSESLVQQATEARAGLAFKPLDSMAPLTASSVSNTSLPPLLRAHSFSYAMFAESVRVMASAGGDFDLAHVQPHWVSAAHQAPAELFDAHHGRLLHTLLAILPFPVLYPYASDAVLRDYSTAFVACLTSTGDAVPTAAASDVRDRSFSALGVVLRYLQSNPDATRNAAFMAVPGTAPLFPEDVQTCCPVAKGTTDTTDATQTASPPPPWLAAETAAVCESLRIVRASRSFTDGVNQAILVGAPYNGQCAMLVGAMLGARLGVRQLPMDWLNATADHRTMATLAIEIAQQTWNPAHH